jgi:hypothetical protein
MSKTAAAGRLRFFSGGLLRGLRQSMITVAASLCLPRREINEGASRRSI